MGPTDNNLLAAFRSGDAHAFETLYARHASGLLAYAMGMLADRTAAEEIIQQVFIGFLSQAGRLPANSSIRGYLFASARNRMANLHRDRARTQALEQNYEVLARARQDNHDGAGAGLETEEIRQSLNAALAKLDDAEREVVLLHTQGDMTFSEIAETLQQPRGTVASRYRAAINRLRGLLDHA